MNLGLLGFKVWELDLGLLGSSHGNWLWDFWDHPIVIGSRIVEIVPWELDQGLLGLAWEGLGI